MTEELIRYDKTTDVSTTSQNATATSKPNISPWGTDNDMQYPIATFHQLGLYQRGNIYYDRAGRSCVVNTKEEYIMTVPSIDQGNFPMNGILGNPLKLRVSIYNDPPIWATHWAPVLTK